MHALSCRLLDSGTFGYAMIPTYYRPNRFLKCKVYIEYVFHHETTTFYHVIIDDILDTEINAINVLSSSLFRCIHRISKKLSLEPIPVTKQLFSKQAMLEEIQSWQKQYVIDVPAPFIVGTEQELDSMISKISRYYSNLSNDFNRMFNV